MTAASLPSKELARLRALHDLQVLDSATEEVFDDLARLAATICRTPIALLSLVDEDRQWFKARVGLEAAQTPREAAFCAHAICEPHAFMEVPDASRDPRFAHNPLVLHDPQIRFYAGVPVVLDDGSAVGTVCALDRAPRELSREQREGLILLGRQASRLLQMRRDARRHQQSLVRQWQEDRQRLRHSLVAATHGLDLQAFVDVDGIYRYVNERYVEYWAMPRERIEGRHARDVLGEAAWWRMQPLLRRALAGEQLDCTLSIDFPGLGPRWVEITYLPVREGDEIVGVVERSHDIDPLCQAQRELERSLQRLMAHNERQQQFIYMVSHDLREPVNTIGNFSGLLAEEVAALPPTSPAQRYLGYVHEGSQRMRSMLDDLLSFVRLDEPSSSFVTVPLAPLIDQVIADLAAPIAAHGARLEVTAQGSVQGLPTQLRLLLQNLVSNAVKFHREGHSPRVEIHTFDLGERLSLRVRDDGIGIPPAHMPKLFAFFRRHVSRQDYPGTGLGLATCQRIVEIHGGSIEVTSVEGEGTTVTIELPKQQQTPS